MPHVSDQVQDLPPGRYGTPRRTPRWLIAVIGVAGVALLLPVLLSAVDKAAPDVRGVITRYAVVSDNAVDVTVDLHKPAGHDASCTVEARNFYSDVVGTTEIRLEGDATSEAIRRTFPTSDKAVVVEVTGCRSTQRAG